jgi:hypothetical protein
MNTIKNIAIIGFSELVTSCAVIAKLPASQVTLAADINANTKKHDNPNYLITKTANNLKSSARLTPAKKIYIIWAVSEADVIRNEDHFTQNKSGQVSLKDSFPYKTVEILSAAEDEEGLCEPANINITTTKL